MIKSIKGKQINNILWLENSNRYISYFTMISIFREWLIPNYQWEEKVFKKMEQYDISFDHFWAKKETFPNEHNLEAWKVLVQPLYEKYVKSQN